MTAAPFQTRSESGSELEAAIAKPLITDTIRASTNLSLGRRIPVPTRASGVPVQVSRSQANWVSVDIGLG